MTDDEILEYIKGLKLGERVIETSGGMRGAEGTIVESTMAEGGLSVRWDERTDATGETGVMTTSITWGTRRLKDAQS